jgi:hypothetical protein
MALQSVVSMEPQKMDFQWERLSGTKTEQLTDWVPAKDCPWEGMKVRCWDCQLEAMWASQMELRTQWETRWEQPMEQLKGNKKDFQTAGWKESYLVWHLE